MKLEITAQPPVKRAGPGRTLLAFIILLNFWLEKGHSTLQRSVLRAGKHGGPTPELKTTQHCVHTALGLRHRAYWFEGCGTHLPALHWICSLTSPCAVRVPSPVLCLPRVLLNLSLVLSVSEFSPLYCWSWWKPLPWWLCCLWGLGQPGAPIPVGTLSVPGAPADRWERVALQPVSVPSCRARPMQAAQWHSSARQQDCHTFR